MTSHQSQHSGNHYQRAAEIVRKWAEQGKPDATLALRENPDLASNKSLVVELALAEFALREQAGEVLDVEAFCNRFPRHHATIGRLLNNQSILIDIDSAQPMEKPLPVLAENMPASRVDTPSDCQEKKSSPPPQSDPSDQTSKSSSMNPKSAKSIGEGTPVKGNGRIPSVGDRVGDYTLLRQLGRGAFATVFLALEETTNRYMVVKLSKLKCDEARVLGQLQHPHIVEIHAAPFDKDSGLYLVTMPFQGAATLEDLLEVAFPKQAKSSPPLYGTTIIEASRRNLGVTIPQGVWGYPDPFLKRCSYIDGIVWLGQRMTSALIAVHKSGFVHQDLKPSNVLLGADGWPRLMDFNLATHHGDTRSCLGGTLPYMAPEILEEIVQGQRKWPNKAVQADIYSLGVILYELFSGTHPFGRFPKGRSLKNGIHQVREKQKAGCQPLDLLVPNVPKRLAKTIEKCLAFEPSQRFLNAEELLNELNRCYTQRQKFREFLNGRTSQVASLTILAGSALLGAAGAFAYHIPSRNDTNSPTLNHAHQGIEHYREGRYLEAIIYLNAAIESEPQRAEYWAMRGKAKAAIGEYAMASTDLQFAMKFGDPNPTTQAVLAWTYLKGFQLQQAFDTAEVAKQAGFASSDLEYIRALAQLFLRNNSLTAETQDTIDSLLRHYPENLKARWFRGFIYANRSLSQKELVNPSTIQDLEAILATPEATCDAFVTAFHIWTWNALKHHEAGHLEESKIARAKAMAHLKAAAERGFDPMELQKAPIVIDVFHPEVDFAEAVAAKKGSYQRQAIWFFPNLPTIWLD